jgi:hypothetical protein
LRLRTSEECKFAVLSLAKCAAALGLVGNVLALSTRRPHASARQRAELSGTRDDIASTPFRVESDKTTIEPRCLQDNTELVIVPPHKLLVKMLHRDNAIAFTVKLVHALKLARRRDILPIRRSRTSAIPLPLEAFPNVVHWIDGLMRIPAWADPWPSDEKVAA